MTPRALVVGLGQPSAGDDGVGLAVVACLRAEGDLAGVACETAAEASALVERLQQGVPAIIVDALVGGGTPGDVVVLEVERVAGDARPLSTHGISVAQAIALARTLAPEACAPTIRLVGIVIATAEVGAAALSPAIAAAVPHACAQVRALLREVMT